MSIDDLLGAYFDAGYQEGKEGRAHDTMDYAAQTALNNIRKALAIRDLEQQAKTADKILEVVSQYSQARRMRTAVEKIQAEIYHKAKALKEKGNEYKTQKDTN